MAGIVGAAVYGFCFLQLFTFSTLYHGIQHTQAHTLEILDHISIYFLIAGTYIRFTYVYAKFFWHYVAIGFVGPHRIRNNLYDFFLGKWKVFSTLIYIEWAVLWSWRADIL
jgi:hemolysin III